jgi:hypothetical protein
MSNRRIVPSRQIVREELSPLELNQMLTLEEVTELTTLSEDSIKRHYAHLIRHLSPRRQAIRLADALSIGHP